MTFLVFALCVPFWLTVGITQLQLLPGLPVSSLAAFDVHRLFVPALAEGYHHQTVW